MHPVNLILEASKYKAIIPTFNVTQMSVVLDVLTYWSMVKFVKQTEVPLAYNHILKARRFNRK